MVFVGGVCGFVQEIVVLDGPESQLGVQHSLVDHLTFEGPNLKEEVAAILFPQPLVFDLKNDGAEVHVV